MRTLLQNGGSGDTGAATYDDQMCGPSLQSAGLAGSMEYIIFSGDPDIVLRAFRTLKSMLRP